MKRRQRWFGRCASIVVLAWLSGCGDSQKPASPGASASAALAPAPPEDVSKGTVSVVGDRSEVPLKGPRVEAKKGDWMIKNGTTVAVVSAVDGRVIDFAPENEEDGLGLVDSVVFDGLETAKAEVVSIEAVVAEGRAVHVVKRILDRPLMLHIWTWLDGDELRIDSMMVGSGPATALSVTLGETTRWGNTRTWVEGHGLIDRGGSFGGNFIARESQGVAYAACSLDGPILARFSAPDLPGFYFCASHR